MSRRDDGDRRTVEVDGERADAERLWEADFESPDELRVERQQPGSEVTFEDNRMRIDCIGEGGVTVWAEREFPEDVLVEYTATCHEPSDPGAESKRNLNCFFCAADEDAPLESNPRDGGYGDYHDWPNYVFTLTYTHSRLRRDPGFEQVSELMLAAQTDHAYEIRLLKRGDRITATVDGRVLHDWTDPDPHGAGWVGMRTYGTDVTYDHWAVYGLD